MPNFLGLSSPGSPTTVVAQFPLVDPLRIRQARLRFDRDEVPELAYANSFYCIGGRWPSRAWVLLDRGSYNQIPSYGPVVLEIDDFVNGPLLFPNLYIIQARCVTRGIAADVDAIYLIELCDAQGLLYSPWFQFPTTSQYNVTAVAYPNIYFSNTLNAGIPWTWNTMVGDLWNQMGTFLGPYPGLPSVPQGVPDNFVFPGVSCWEAINEVLDFLGMTIAQNPQSVNPYAIVSSGNADLAFQALQAKFVANLEDDREWIDVGAGRLPGQVQVFFHRQNQFYGTEETVRNDNLQWSTTPFYVLTVPAPAPFNQAPGIGYLWDDFMVRYDVDGNPLAADTATAMTIATERVNQFYNTIHRGTLGFMRQTYSGTLPFSTGSQCDGVKWFHNYAQGRSGWRTEIIRGYFWPEMEFTLNARGVLGVG